MSYLVMAVLGVFWLCFFLPSLLQSRRASPFASVSAYQESLWRISTGRAVTPEQAAVAEAQRRRCRHLARRRDTLVGLAAAVLVSGVLGAVVGGAARLLALVPTSALLVYVALLRHYAVSQRPVGQRVGGGPGRARTARRPRLVVAEQTGDGESDLRRAAGLDAGLDRIAG